LDRGSQRLRTALSGRVGWRRERREEDGAVEPNRERIEELMRRYAGHKGLRENA
jgi:hypothetical protein